MINTILGWIGSFLGWIDSWAGSYLLALLIFAFIIELLMLPFGIIQQKNSRRQARLRPKEMAIRKKYAGRNDKVTQQKVTEEIQQLYQQEKVNMFAGCLPTLIQLPVILALYQVVIKPLSYVVHMGSDAINNLATLVEYDIKGGEIGLISKVRELVAAGTLSKDCAELAGNFDRFPNFTNLGLDLGLTPTITKPSWLLIVPALTFLIYFASMKLTRKFTFQPTQGASDQQTACSNKVMDIVMPLFSFFISFRVPAAVGVYWIFKSVLGTLKQFILMKVMPLPVFTEEDYKAAEKEYKSNTKYTPRDLPESDGPVKSLHHIDDDDDEPYPTFVGEKSYFDKTDEEKKSDTESDDEKKNAPAKNDKIEAAPLKDDRDDENKKDKK